MCHLHYNSECQINRYLSHSFVRNYSSDSNQLGSVSIRLIYGNLPYHHTRSHLKINHVRSLVDIYVYELMQFDDVTLYLLCSINSQINCEFSRNCLDMHHDG